LIAAQQKIAQLENQSKEDGGARDTLNRRTKRMLDAGGRNLISPLRS
jgi:hypothetical protein